jgi:hypothetical protein
MKNAFKWLCLVCICVVLATIPIGIFELVVLNDPKANLLGCSVGQFADIQCGGGALSAVEETILNLPFGFLMAPLFLIHPSFILNDILVPPSMHPWLKYTHPLVIYLYALNLILILAITYIFRSIFWFAMSRWKHRS